MPTKSLILFVIFCVFGIEISSTSAQDLQNGVNFSKHTIGFGLGYTYPKLADGTKRGRVESDFNFGLSGAFEWGKYYNSGISFMISPMVYYSNYSNSIKNYDSYNVKDNKLRYRTEWAIQFNEWAVCLPVSYEFPLLKHFRLGAGASLALPLANSGSINRKEYDYYISNSQGGFYINPKLRDDYTYVVDYYLEPELGVTGKLLYQIHTNERVESYLSVEYWYNITVGEPGYAHKTRFALTYIHRYIQLKEVREKWDRYWIRKNKSKG